MVRLSNVGTARSGFARRGVMRDEIRSLVLNNQGNCESGDYTCLFSGSKW